MAKMSQIKCQGQKWAHFRKEYFNSDFTYDTTVWMAYVQRADLFYRKIVLSNYPFWLSYYLLKKLPN